MFPFDSALLLSGSLSLSKGLNNQLVEDWSNSIYCIASLELFDDVVCYYTVYVDDVVSYVAAGLVNE